MSIITRLIQHDSFVQEVKQQIIANVIDRQANAYTKDGLIEGTVTAYELQAEPVFDAADGSGLEWSIPFKVTGEATIGYKTSDGDYGDDTTNGPCKGFAEITFPDDTLASDDFDHVASSVEIIVTVESAALDAKEPSIEPDIE